MKRWTVFLDRDGVINQKAPARDPPDYIKSWAEFHWLPGSLEALRLLHESGALVVVITNQRGVATRLIRPEDLEDIHRRLQAEATRAGGPLDGIYVCPHADGTCDCRKPAVGLFLRAWRDLPDISLKRSVVVGDSPSDIEAGKRLGARTVHIRRDGATAVPGADAEAPDLLAAVRNPILSWI